MKIFFSILFCINIAPNFCFGVTKTIEFKKKENSTRTTITLEEQYSQPPVKIKASVTIVDGKPPFFRHTIKRNHDTAFNNSLSHYNAAKTFFKLLSEVNTYSNTDDVKAALQRHSATNPQLDFSWELKKCMLETQETSARQNILDEATRTEMVLSQALTKFEVKISQYYGNIFYQHQGYKKTLNSSYNHPAWHNFIPIRRNYNWNS